MANLGRTIVIGFVAAVISVLVFHQGTIWGMRQLGWISAQPWNITGRVPPYGVPVLANLCFWGGLWGILIALLLRATRLPPLLTGFLIGVVAALVGWTIVPMWKGGVLFAGGSPTALLRGAFINGTFGWGTALILNTFFRRA